MNVGPSDGPRIATEAESKSRTSAKSGEALAKASPAARPGEGPQAGAPPTRVKTVDRATLIELVNGAKGRPTAVVFWASWVAHREILPKIMADVRKKHPRFRVFLVSLASDESRTQVATESGSLDADEICVHYSRDIDEALAAFELDADGLPGVRVYDPQGRLVVSFGLEADTPDALLRVMEKRLAEAAERIPERD